MAAIPAGQVLLSIYGWISMCVYSYLVYKLLKWRREAAADMRQFRSSYYLLFLLQAVADFYSFLSIELIQNPKKYNYFNLISADMHAFAVVSYVNLAISSSVINCGHVVIAFNRLTAFYKPVTYQKIWSRARVLTIVFSLWSVFILYPLILVYLREDTVYLIANEKGEFSSTSLSLNPVFSIINCVRGATTVTLCSICYTLAFIKRPQTTQGIASTERRLLLCALASTVGFLPNFIGTVFLATASFGSNSGLANFAIQLWYYENEIMATIPIWLQLAINTSVRRLLLGKPRNRPQTALNISIFSTKQSLMPTLLPQCPT